MRYQWGRGSDWKTKVRQVAGGMGQQGGPQMAGDAGRRVYTMGSRREPLEGLLVLPQVVS